MSDIAGEDIPRRWTTSRVEAFSDGVFAIAITLLVLDIKLNASDFDHLARALLHQWPAYLSYVTSFLTVGSVWIAHHNLFTRLKVRRRGAAAHQHAAADGSSVPALPHRRARGGAGCVQHRGARR